MKRNNFLVKFIVIIYTILGIINDINRFSIINYD